MAMTRRERIMRAAAAAALTALTLATGCPNTGDEGGGGEPAVVETPVASPPEGRVGSGVTVTLTCATPGAVILYTTDGSDPVASGTVGPGEITITRDTTLKALGRKTGMTDSAVMTAVYSDLAADLAELPENTAGDPATVVVTAMDVSTDWSKILARVSAAGRYVILDLSDCAVSGGAAGTADPAVPAGTITGAVTPTGNDMNVVKDNVWVKGVILPEALDTIGDSAFHGCAALTSVTIPGGVEKIGDSAFDGCVALTAVTIPGNVEKIGSSAFNGCAALASVVIPAGVKVKTISNGAFARCAALTSVVIPASVTVIDDYAFYDCVALASVTIPGGVETIGSSAFNGCAALTSVTLPGSVITIGDSAFDGNLAAVYAGADGGAGTYTRERNGTTWTRETEGA